MEDAVLEITDGIAGGIIPMPAGAFFLNFLKRTGWTAGGIIRARNSLLLEGRNL